MVNFLWIVTILGMVTILSRAFHTDFGMGGDTSPVPIGGNKIKETKTSTKFVQKLRELNKGKHM